MGDQNVYVLPNAQNRDREIGYDDLCHTLGVSKRWLRYRVAEGMPAHTDYCGRRKFVLGEVRPWLDEWKRKKGRAA